MPGIISYDLPDELELPHEQRRDASFMLSNGLLLRFTPFGVDQKIDKLVFPQERKGKVLIDHASKVAVLVAVSTHPRDNYTDVLARQMQERDLRDLPTIEEAYHRLLATFTPEEHIAQLKHGHEIAVQADGMNLGDPAIVVTHQAFASYN